MPGNEYGGGAQRTRSRGWHSCTHTQSTSLVGRRGHDTTIATPADDHGFA